VPSLFPSSRPSAVTTSEPSPVSVTTCSGKTNGTYTIVTESTSFSGYCYNNYLLLAKLNGASSVWSYSNAIWYDTTTYNPTSLLMDTTTEAKLTAYNSFPINSIRIGMTSDTVANAVFSDITLSTSYTSLQALFSNGSSFTTSLGLAGWLNMVGLESSDLEIYCLVEGFNIGVTGTDKWYQDGISAYSKIGITLNNEANCNTNDAGIGFGMYNSYSSYEPHPCGAFMKNKKYTRIGYIL